MQQVPPLFIAESVLSNLEILQMLLVSFFYIKKKKKQLHTWREHLVPINNKC